MTNKSPAAKLPAASASADAPMPTRTSFTPAPWEVGYDAQEVYALPGYKSVCMVLGDVVEGPNNARLIACAPELYEAAAELDRMWSEDFSPPGDMNEPRLLAPETLAVWRAFRAALAKARGDAS